MSKQLGKVKRASFSFYGEGRFGDDVTRAKTYIFGPQMKLRLSPMMSLNSTVNFFNTRVGERFAKAIRYDLGMNLKFKLSERWQLDQRLRYEFFDPEKASGVPRLRARAHFSRPLSGKRLVGWYSNGEWFYETKDALFTQFRLVPIGFKFALSKRVTMGAHYLLVDRRSKIQNHVLVTSFKF